MNKIGVIGHGSWATALIKILLDNNQNTIVNWFWNKQEDIDFLYQNLHNPRYLTDVKLDISKINFTNNLQLLIEKNEVLLIAVPSAFLHSQIENFKSLFKDKTIITAVKGVVPHSHQIVSNYLKSEFEVDENKIAAISGPCHAEEVALEKLSYLTIASANKELADSIKILFSCPYIYSKSTIDIEGIEFAAVLKNVYAIASGVCHGLGYGDNFQSVLVSNSIREIENFLDAHHQIHRDVKESAYLGDLMVTAYSQFSRNRTFGNMLGKGYSVKSAQLEMNMVAEGFYATKTMFEINKETNARMPILTAMFDIIYNQKPARNTIKNLCLELS